jgi:hypothetical protein
MRSTGALRRLPLCNFPGFVAEPDATFLAGNKGKKDHEKIKKEREKVFCHSASARSPGTSL